MIGSLRGTLGECSIRSAGPMEVVVDVRGVGYRVLMGSSALAALGPEGSDVSIHVHTHLREDALVLYGFVSKAERDCFEALISVRTVGPGVALAMLSVHSPGSLRRIVSIKDVDALRLVPGIGAKTAARLVIELESKLDDFYEFGGSEESSGDQRVDGAASRRATAALPSVREDLRSALASLGYGPDEIRYAESVVSMDGPVGDVLKLALRELAARR